MLGNPGNTKPEFCMNVAGPWTLDFEIMECRNAISSTQDANAAALARDIGTEVCANAGRVFAGVRPYLRGAAFLHKAVDG